MKKKKITSKIQFLWEGKEQAQNECNTPPKYTYKLPETIGNEIHCVDNLDFLKLNQERLKGKVKCIYIDPPYNTGNDFIYKDKRHSKGECKHSKWLSFMLPRLKLARDLLREDGVIFVSIDDNEQANLKLLMDEVFGEENCIAQLVWRKKKESANDGTNISTKTEFILCYTKACGNINRIDLKQEYLKNSYSNSNNDPRGLWRCVSIKLSVGHQGSGYKYKIHTPNGKIYDDNWIMPEKTYLSLLNDNRIYFGKNNDAIPQKIIFANESQGQIPDNLLLEYGTNKDGKKAILEFFNVAVFDTAKPVSLIKHLLTISTTEGDLVLDFFAGSGTTGQAVMELNHENPEKAPRNFILVQWNEEIKEGKEAHKFCVENGLEPVISSITVERLRRAGAKYKGDVGFEVFDY
jgi:adenine-specific DNA-methyltransferase